MNDPIRVAVTGAAGNIGYSLLWRIASGECFGPGQPVILQMLEVTPVLDKLRGVEMELVDSAFPLVHGLVSTDDPNVAFAGADAVFLVGSRPRSKDMNRSDLVAANGPIFVSQGRALDAHASRRVKVLTVGNPCNTNCLIARANAPGLSDACFSAMTRLDQNRAVAQLAIKAGAPVAAVQDVFVWGNHSDLMVPDIRLATVGGRKASGIFDRTWLDGDFMKAVATRGKQIIVARGASSAASAASAAIDAMRDWWSGSGGRIASMAIPSRGWYDVPEGLVFSFPVKIGATGEVSVVEGLDLDEATRTKIKANVDELLGERAAVSDLV